MEGMNLHYQAVSSELREMLHRLMQEEAFQDFYLVGGTALALKLGHRQSDDLDLFCSASFDPKAIEGVLSSKFDAQRIYSENDTVRAFISGIKVDLLSHSYPLLDKTEIWEKIRMASLKDLAAMKLNAVSGRGVKKDFWDVAALCKVFSLEEMIGFFQQKYAQSDSWHLLKSLSYFLDADNDPTPIRALDGTTWQGVKSTIQREVNKLI